MRIRLRFLAYCVMGFALVMTRGVSAAELDKILTRENTEKKISLAPAPLVDDLAYLRRVSVDLIGRIPSYDEIQEYMGWPATERRTKVVEKLLAHERFADRWTTFFADMLRLRANQAGGAALTAHIHRSLEKGLPYDELVKKLILSNGKANAVPEVGFVLGDDADPMALASATAQVFMGVRMGCAQCHDHPFDTWTREDFYGLAAYYGKTRRVESQLTKVVYTTEADQTTVLWPPEGVGSAGDRKPMKPKFPIDLAKEDRPSKPIARLAKMRADLAAKQVKKKVIGVDDLLADSAEKVKLRVGDVPEDALGVDNEAKKEIRKIDINASLYRPSQQRAELADFITNPKNRYFSRSLVNRVWADLVGRGFVEPADDFREDNPASHNATLDYLADEFVASGFDFRSLVKLVVSSDTYQRQHVTGVDAKLQAEMEAAFVATPMRRMMGEALYDSVVVAGHLFETKHRPGTNERVIVEKIRIPKSQDGKPAKIGTLAQGGPAMKGMAGNRGSAEPAGYELEAAIEVNFSAVLDESEDEVALDKMSVMSKEELEAQRMMQMRNNNMPATEYIEKIIKRVVDENPSFVSSLRMASPAPEGHFLRVFGQPARDQLGDLRDSNPSMRQALMMLNGRLSHEASRVGELEPMHKLLTGKASDLSKAVRLAYREILTREPNAQELSEGQQIVQAGPNSLDGMADLRWVLLNCNEFRYLP